MIKYIAILRGINVGGKRKILMADLKNLFIDIGFSNIQTYIQSGNVVFETKHKEDQKKIAKKIETGIAKRFNLDVPVIVRMVDELENVIKTNPFLLQEDCEIERLHVTFLADTPAKENVKKLNEKQYGTDKYHLTAKEVFIFCYGKSSDSKLSNKLFEDKLKVSATSRNWKTVLSLYNLAIK